MKRFEGIVLCKEAPESPNVVWAKIDGEEINFYVCNNGKWGKLGFKTLADIITTLNNKADKTTGGVGNFAKISNNGNAEDSGISKENLLRYYNCELEEIADPKEGERCIVPEYTGDEIEFVASETVEHQYVGDADSACTEYIVTVDGNGGNMTIGPLSSSNSSILTPTQEDQYYFKLPEEGGEFILAAYTGVDEVTELIINDPDEDGGITVIPHKPLASYKYDYNPSTAQVEWMLVH